MKITRSQLKKLIKEEMSRIRVPTAAMEETKEFEPGETSDNLIDFPKPAYLAREMPAEDQMDAIRGAVRSADADESVWAIEDEVEDQLTAYLDNFEAGVTNLSDYEDEFEDDYEDDDYNFERLRMSDSDEDYDKDSEVEDNSISFDFSKF